MKTVHRKMLPARLGLIKKKQIARKIHFAISLLRVASINKVIFIK